VTYAKWINTLDISGLELSCGSALYSFMNMCRGGVPVNDFVSALPGWKKPVGKIMLKNMVGKFELEEGYNIEAARLIKPIMNGTPLAVVGGLRSRIHMEEIIEQGIVDLISMSRPFIREPDLVEKFKAGKADRSSCISCNKCLAAIVNGKPVRCYDDLIE